MIGPPVFTQVASSGVFTHDTTMGAVADAVDKTLLKRRHAQSDRATSNIQITSGGVLSHQRGHPFQVAGDSLELEAGYQAVQQSSVRDDVTCSVKVTAEGYGQRGSRSLHTGSCAPSSCRVANIFHETQTREVDVRVVCHGGATQQQMRRGERAIESEAGKLIQECLWATRCSARNSPPDPLLHPGREVQSISRLLGARTQ